MWGILAASGGTLAGLFFIWTVLPSLMRAWSTGVIVSKAYGAPKIERAVDPERFKAMLANRVGTLWTGISIFGVSFFLLAYQLLSLWLFSKGYR